MKQHETTNWKKVCDYLLDWIAENYGAHMASMAKEEVEAEINKEIEDDQKDSIER